jgi:hypothetical protein
LIYKGQNSIVRKSLLIRGREVEGTQAGVLKIPGLSLPLLPIEDLLERKWFLNFGFRVSWEAVAVRV